MQIMQLAEVGKKREGFNQGLCKVWIWLIRPMSSRDQDIILDRFCSLIGLILMGKILRHSQIQGLGPLGSKLGLKMEGVLLGKLSVCDWVWVGFNMGRLIERFDGFVGVGFGFFLLSGENWCKKSHKKKIMKMKENQLMNSLTQSTIHRELGFETNRTQPNWWKPGRIHPSLGAHN